MVCCIQEHDIMSHTPNFKLFLFLFLQMYHVYLGIAYAHTI